MNELLNQLKRHEGYRSSPYRCPSGYWTIGYGHRLSADKEISEREAERLSNGYWEEKRATTVLRDDIRMFEFQVRTRLHWFRQLDQPRQDALVNMAFNMGVEGLLKFRQMLAALQMGDYKLAAKEALDSKWARQVGSRATELADQIRTGQYRDPP